VAARYADANCARTIIDKGQTLISPVFGHVVGERTGYDDGRNRRPIGALQLKGLGGTRNQCRFNSDDFARLEWLRPPSVAVRHSRR